MASLFSPSLLCLVLFRDALRKLLFEATVTSFTRKLYRRRMVTRTECKWESRFNPRKGKPVLVYQLCLITKVLGGDKVALWVENALLSQHEV